MGLVLNCARCHDHKFDPIPQEDYYKLVGLYSCQRTIPTTGCRARINERYYLAGSLYPSCRKVSARTGDRDAHTVSENEIKSLERRKAGKVRNHFHDQWLIAKG